MAGGKELKLAISIGAKIDKTLGSTINNVQSQLGKIGNIANKIGMATTAAVAAGATKIIHDSVQAYTEYESALNSAAATAGVEKGSAAYEQMNAAAREAGATTVKTAKESAQALEYMALAGWSVEDSTKALTPILKLSAAAGMELATTSDLVTDTMAGMGLGINDLGRYLDVLSKANNSANHNSQQLLESYIGAGAVLRNLNVPIEKSAAVLGVMANQGLKGSEAGTALNAILVNMQKKSGDSYKAMSKLGVSMYDSAGNARDLLQVFQDVHDKTASMTEEQRNLMYQMIGGKAHLADFAMIMNGFTASAETGTAQVYDLEKAYNGAQGTLDKFYDIKTDTLEGSITRLNSAYEGMLLNIGERLAPTVSNAVNNLVDKMPQIENAIMSFLNTIIPAGTAAIDLLTRNPDKVIKAVTGIAKAFLLFKGITILATLAKDLKTLTSAASGLSVLKGAAGALTGLGTGATAAVGAVGALVAPIAAVAAGLGVVYAINERKEHWADGMNEQADAVQTATDKLTKYNKLIQTVADQREIISNPYSSTEAVETARAKLQEVAGLLEKEYNLTINADTTQLENALDMAQSLSRAEYISSGAQYLQSAADKASSYKGAKAELPSLQSEHENAIQRRADLVGFYARGQMLQTQFANKSISADYYTNEMKKVRDAANSYGYSMVYGKSASDASVTSTEFLNNLNNLADNAQFAVDRALSKVTTARNQLEEFESSAQKAGNAFAQALASDTKTGNLANIDNDIAQMQTLGQTMVQAGGNTDELSTAFAKAKLGYTDFSKAIADGKAAEMAENYLQFKTQIGDTAESAIQGAALIANGFETVEKATAAGASGIDSVIASMKQIGDTHRLFSGLDNAGIADKLSDMAHAINLIPENKTITVDAQGNFSVIEDAQNQIASLKSIGNVDVSVTASGDFSVINEATGEIQTLQGMGAVSLQVNADGNIEVLNRAQEVIATIDSKNAQFNIDGNVSNMKAVEDAANAANKLDSKTAKITIDAQDNATGNTQKVQDAITKLNSTSSNSPLKANDQATSVINSVSNKLNILDGKTARTVIITEYKTSGTTPAHNAAGTPSWRGGLTYLNDQPGISDPREVVEYKGQRYWFGGRDVLADVPQGARIYNAAESRGMIDESEADDYRTGSGAFGRAIDRLRYTRSESGASSGGESGGMNVTYSPNIVIEGNADEAAISRALRSGYDDFTEYMDRYNREQRRKSFGVA